jgi:bifunctional DNA-binding transcriptional regulator/antitoxin component of YhaV-PrlF toxin-antitoxin module
VFAVTNQGYLGLPAPVRRWCGLLANDRVFLVAEPDDARLVVYSPAALDAMVAASSAQSPLGGAQ